MVGFEEGADNGEDYDCEARYDDAGEECVSGGPGKRKARRSVEGRRGVYHVHALKADTTGFIVAEVAYRSSSRAVGVLFLVLSGASSECYRDVTGWQ